MFCFGGVGRPKEGLGNFSVHVALSGPGKPIGRYRVVSAGTTYSTLLNMVNRVWMNNAHSRPRLQGAAARGVSKNRSKQRSNRTALEPLLLVLVACARNLKHCSERCFSCCDSSHISFMFCFAAKYINLFYHRIYTPYICHLWFESRLTFLTSVFLYILF